jgi:hypothetical protein
MARSAGAVGRTRAAALFVSHIPVSSRPDRAEVDAAVADAVRRHGGSRGCAAEMAACYGDYPEIAVARMRWARAVIAYVYDSGDGAGSHRRPGLVPIARRRRLEPVAAGSVVDQVA